MRTLAVFSLRIPLATLLAFCLFFTAAPFTKAGEADAAISTKENPPNQRKKDQESEVAGRYLSEGIRQYKEENFEEAAEILGKAREADPTSSTAAFFLGLAYKQMLDYPEAIKNFRDSVTLKPRIKEGVVELVHVLFMSKEEGSLEEAKKWSAVAEKAEIKPARIAFLKGMILGKEGLHEEAIACFERAKSLDPSQTQAADFQISASYLRMKQFSKAQESLQAVVVHDPQSDLASFARQYQDMLKERLDPIRMTVGVFGSINDNLITRTDDPAFSPATATKDKSLGLATSFRLNYAPIMAGDYLFNASYAVSSSLNGKNATTYDSLTNSFSMVPGYNFGNYSLSWAVSYDHTLKRNPGYEDYSGTFKTGPLLRVIAAPQHLLEFYCGYANTDYFQPQTIGQEAEDRQSDATSASISWIWLFKPDAFFNLKYERVNDNTDGYYWSNTADKLSANLALPLAQNVKLQISGQVNRQDYDSPRPELNFTNSTLTIKTREDEIRTGSIGLSWNFRKDATLITQYSKTGANSTVKNYDYTQNIMTLGVEYRF